MNWVPGDSQGAEPHTRDAGGIRRTDVPDSAPGDALASGRSRNQPAVRQGTEHSMDGKAERRRGENRRPAKTSGWPASSSCGCGAAWNMDGTSSQKAPTRAPLGSGRGNAASSLSRPSITGCPMPPWISNPYHLNECPCATFAPTRRPFVWITVVREDKVVLRLNNRM